jgi:hypothetical protein
MAKVTKHAEKENQRKAAKKKQIRLVSIGAAIVVVIFACALFLNSALPMRSLTALSVEGKDGVTVNISPTEYKFFYRQAVTKYENGVYSMFPDNYSEFLPNSSLPLDAQIFDETTGETWADRYRTLAANEAKEYASIWAEILNKGEQDVLSDEKEEQVETTIETMKIYIGYGLYGASVKNLKSYLSSVFGKGMDEDTYRRLLREQFVIEEYTERVSKAFSYTPEQIASKYSENKDKFDTFEYRYVLINHDAQDLIGDDDAAVTAAMAEAKKLAEKVQTAKSENEFLALVDEALAEVEAKKDADSDAEADSDAAAPDSDSEETVKPDDTEAAGAKAAGDDESAAEPEDEDTDTTSPLKFYNAEFYHRHLRGGLVSPSMQEWMYSSSRETGDIGIMSVLENETRSTGWYVVYYIGRNDNQYATASFREILIKPAEVSESSYMTSDESGTAVLDDAAFQQAKLDANAAAKKSAEDLLVVWGKDGELDYTAAEPEPTPTPTPTADPEATPTPAPSEEPTPTPEPTEPPPTYPAYSDERLLAIIMDGKSAGTAEYGLYENVAKYDSVQSDELLDYLYGEDRADGTLKKGDYKLIPVTDTNGYTSYHIVLFLDWGISYHDYLADKELRDADIAAWAEHYKDTVLKKHWGFRFA